MLQFSHRWSALKISFLVLLGLIFLIPLEAQLSGSFTMYYGEKEYLIQCDNQRHKIYTRDTDVDALYRRYQSEMLGLFEAKAPELERLLAEAKHKNIAIAPIQLLWPEITIERPEDLARVSPASYPLILAFPIARENDGGLLLFKVGIQAALAPAQARWLQAGVTRLLAPQGDAVALAETVILADYQCPTAQQVYALFAVNVGGTFMATASVRDFYQGQLQALLKQVGPVLEKEVSRPDFEKRLGLKLTPLERVFKKSDPLGAERFNPNGPMVDEADGLEFLRPRYETPQVQVITLFVGKKGGWGVLADQIPALLERSLHLDPAHTLSAKTDALLMQLASPEVRSNVFDELGQIKQVRVVTALVQVLQEKGRSESQRSAALGALRTVVGKETPDKVVTQILAFYNAHPGDYSLQQNTLQVLGAIPTAFAAREILKLYADSSMSDIGNPYFTRQNVLEALTRVGASAVPPLNDALKTKPVQKDARKMQELTKVLEVIQQK